MNSFTCFSIFPEVIKPIKFLKLIINDSNNPKTTLLAETRRKIQEPRLPYSIQTSEQISLCIKLMKIKK